MTEFPEIWNALAARMPEGCVKERAGSGGRTFKYITARGVMNRLDGVIGFEGWEDSYERDANGSDAVLCRLTITLPDGRKVTKCDVGAPGNTGDDGDDEKGAVSDSFKRAAVKFGIGRYLYGEGVYVAPTEGDAAGPPAVEPLPPAPAPPPRREAESSARREESAPSRDGLASPPRSGSALFGWLKDQEKRSGVGLMKYIDEWGRMQGFPKMYKEWSRDQVAQGTAEAIRKLQSARAGSREEALAN